MPDNPISIPRRNWTRDETLIALNLYCHTPFGRLHARNPEIIATATALGRTADALAMKCCNLAAFDPAQRARGIRGLSKASRLDQDVWNEFASNPEDVAYTSETALSALTSAPLRVAKDVQWEDVSGMDRLALTRVRVNQQFFRAMILSGYRNQCAVCELSVASLLTASHIVPWSIDQALRMSPTNGICLCALHDRAFDRGLLIIESDFTIAVHEEFKKHSPNRAVEDGFLRFDGTKLSLPDRWHPDGLLLHRRRAIVTAAPSS